MTWETSATQSAFDANAASTTMMSNRESNRSGAGNIAYGSGGGLFKSAYSVVGLNVGQVDSMRQAIRDYVSRIESRLRAIEPLADASNAFRSNDQVVEQAVTANIEKVKEYCVNLTSTLLAFSDKLGDVKNSWTAATQQMASNISADTSANDAATKYQETIN